MMELLRLKIALVGAICNTILFGISCAIAQITPDGTLPNNSIVTPSGSTFNITGGTIAGGNLFHSFSSFSVPTRGTAFFNNGVDIQNIISRVTGGSISNIDGVIRANGTANVFLINPNGIIFGPNASLNVGGSFVASTANGIQFGNLGFFSATNPEAPSPLLTINPLALLFNQMTPAPIQNNSIAPAGIDPAGFNAFGLRVVDGKSLLLVGGNINMDGGQLNAYGGRVELSGLIAPGNVGLNVEGDKLSLDNPASITPADISLTNGAGVSVEAAGGGSIAVNARNLEVSSGSFLSAGIVSPLGEANTTAGEITINARDRVNINYSSVLSSVVQGAVGNGGTINITTGSLALTNGAEVGTSTDGQGNAGSITINARDTVSLDGNKSSVFSGVSSNMSPNVLGNGGNINITTGSLNVTNNAQLVTVTYAKGSAGSITINARDRVTMDFSSVFSRVEQGGVGSGGDINITTNSLALTNGTQLNTSTSGRAKAGNVTINARDTVTFDGTADAGGGNRNPSGVFSRLQEGAVGTAGDINITTGSLRVLNGAQLTASTDGQGKAGNVTINARDTVTFDGTDGNIGNVGSSGAFSQVNRTALGKGGTIDITTGSLTLDNGAQLSARTAGQGNAGNVTINARDRVQLNNGEIFTNATSNATSGEGGNVSITAKDIRLRNNSLIRTDLSRTQGSGGNITLSANTILALENSDILAFAPQGKGGNITFNTRVFLSDPLYRPSKTTTEGVSFESLRNNGRVDVNASGAVSGTISGVPDSSFIQNSLTELPQNLIDPNVLIANSCIVRSRKQQLGTFTITGAGGLPNRPGDVSVSSYPTGVVRSIPDNAASRPWHKGDPIVEPQGVYQLPKGHLVLSRECDS